MNNSKIEKTDLLNQLSRREAFRLLGAGAIGAGSLAFIGETAAAQTSNALPDKNLTATQGAGFYKFKVGALECFVISDGVFTAPPFPTFAVNASKPAAENVLRDYFLATNQVTVHINALLVKSGNKTVLIDTGSGANFGPTAGQLINNLTRAGVAPETITDVVFTHAHVDHAGGNTDATGKIAFPNARFHISQNEWETWTAKNVNLGQTKVDAQTGKSFIEITQKNLLPLKDRVSIFKPGAEIVTGISSVAAVGHTPGHTAYLVASGNESLLHAGDFAHHFAFQLVHPEWFTIADFEPTQAVATRKKLLDRAATDRTLIVGSHMPFPGLGHIRASNAARTSYEWIPVVWQW